MEKTDANAFSPNPLLDDLRRAGINPIPQDETLGLGMVARAGRPRKDEEALVPVSGRISAQARKMLTLILDARVIPGVETTSEAVSAALTLWVELVYPRLTHNGLTDNWRHLRAIKNMYDSAMARVQMVRNANWSSGGVKMLLAQGERAEAREALRSALRFMVDLSMEWAFKFEQRLLEGADDELRALWEQTKLESAEWEEKYNAYLISVDARMMEEQNAPAE